MSDNGGHDGVLLLVDLAVTALLLVLALLSSLWWLPVALGWGVVSALQAHVLRRSR